MKKLLVAISVIIVMAIVFATILFSNKGDEKYLAEHASDSPSPSHSEVPPPSPSVTPSPSVSPSPSEAPYAGPTNPLTGLPSDEGCAMRRPYAIMINNISVAQPQLGVSKADIIYEILVEGGITRMMAVFQDVSNAGEIGSIRSARPYFVDIAQGYDAVYIHAGGSPDAYSELKSIGITSFDGVNGGKQDIFYRAKDRLKMGYEHSLVTTSDLMEKYMPEYGIRLLHNDGYECNMVFRNDAGPTGAHMAEKVVVHFSSSKTTTFEYDDGLYGVSQYKKAYIDGGNDTQIAVTNLVIVETSINAIYGDDKGRIDVDVSGSGEGMFFCGGRYEMIQWSRKSNTSQYVFTYMDGSPLEFGRGKSYFCVIDGGNKVEIT